MFFTIPRKIFVLMLSMHFCFLLSAENKSTSEQADSLFAFLSRVHYSPRTLNAEMEQDIKKGFLNDIDPRCNYLLLSDSLFIANSSFIENGHFSAQLDSFFNQFVDLYVKRVQSADSLLNEYKHNDVSLDDKSKKIQFIKSWEHAGYCQTAADVRSKVSKGLQFKILFDLALQSDSLYKNDPQAFKAKMDSVRLHVVEKDLCKNEMLLNPQEGLRKKFENIFYLAIANAFDPHTLYLSNQQKQNFQYQLSREELSCGLLVERDEKGDIVVSHLVPGGPAWNSLKINKGDKVIAYRAGLADKQLVKCNDLSTLNQLLFSSTDSLVELTFEKEDGLIQSVKLQKEKQLIEENVLRGYVLGEKEKVGYVSLPGFYTDWDKSSVNGCANDMAKEILKFKKDSVKGLIIDLRNNGGGSLQEALSLSGIFIDQGPLFYTRSKDERPHAVKDINRGTIYDGPMVVVINGRSASASELFAAIMQDYNRALIVGAPSFGKASMQGIFPLQNDMGFANVTIGKIYRICGKGHQAMGVQPDLVISNEKTDYFRESNYNCVLINDTIKSSPYYKPLSVLPIQNIKDRIAAKSSGKKQSEKRNFYQESIPLDVDGFMSYFSELEDSGVQANLLIADNNSSDKLILQLDELKSEINKLVLTDIKQDQTVEEAYEILVELINQTKE